MVERLRAKAIINQVKVETANWETPQCGTPNQHRYICKLAKGFEYDNLPEFLASWYNYDLLKEEDGSLRPLQAHWLIGAHRGGLIPIKGRAPRTAKLRKEWEAKNGITKATDSVEPKAEGK